MTTESPVVSTGDLALALLVDRDPDTRRLYGDYLRLAARFDIDEADDGRQALARAIARPPAIVVTETRLPGISGFDLCTELRRDSVTSAIPVIFVTGDVLETDVRRARRAGADAVLTKPCLPEVLLGEIRRVFSKSEDLHRRSDQARAKMIAHVRQSKTLIEQAHAGLYPKRAALSHSHVRGEITAPATPPPALLSPHCDSP